MIERGLTNSRMVVPLRKVHLDRISVAQDSLAVLYDKSLPVFSLKYCVEFNSKLVMLTDSESNILKKMMKVVLFYMRKEHGFEDPELQLNTDNLSQRTLRLVSKEPEILGNMGENTICFVVKIDEKRLVVEFLRVYPLEQLI